MDNIDRFKWTISRRQTLDLAATHHSVLADVDEYYISFRIGSLRSPLIVTIPGKNASATGMRNAFFHVRDIIPTLLDLVGVSNPGTLNGRGDMPN